MVNYLKRIKMETLKEHWPELVLGFLAFMKIVVNLTPSEKDNKIFSWLDALIDAVVPNNKKGGGTHAS